MDTAPLPGDGARAARFEGEAEEQRRLVREVDAQNPGGAERRRQRTLTALADVDAGRLIDDEAMQAWADSLGTDRELPVPQPG
jgi:hypothetical protein